ncbi:MAG: M48 family metallopeptidase [Gaiellaceae bacterium]
MTLPDPFTPGQIEQSRRYHRPLYRALVLDLTLGGSVLAALAYTRAGESLYRPVRDAPWWGAALGFAALVILASDVVRLPLSFWRGFARERRWGFSTQTARSWLADQAKGVAIGIVLTAMVELALVGLARRFPHGWPLPAAAGLALAVLLVSFLAPVVLEPLFNRFSPLADEALAAELRTLAQRAGLPVRDLLVADASRRTRKVNAYVSGLGRTRRVVLFDTLLERAEPEEIRLIVAHELGHRREGHVLKGTLLGMLSAVVAVAVVWTALGTEAADPRNTPVMLLLGFGLELAALAPGSALSRQWERAADRCSLELTRDLGAFVRAHTELALANLSDLDPPRPLYVLLFSHPTARERIAAARAWAA